MYYWSFSYVLKNLDSDVTILLYIGLKYLDKAGKERFKILMLTAKFIQNEDTRAF